MSIQVEHQKPNLTVASAKTPLGLLLNNKWSVVFSIFQCSEYIQVHVGIAVVTYHSDWEENKLPMKLDLRHSNMTKIEQDFYLCGISVYLLVLNID